MKTLGIVSMGHDASVALIENDQILFAAHAERYSGKKNDPNINEALLEDCFQYGTPDHIVWYERPLAKLTRHLYAGQWNEVLKPGITEHLVKFQLGNIPTTTVGHHHSHAAAGYYTSGFDDATVLVCDAIGEWNTISIWQAEGKEMKKVWAQSYPDSLGLLYSAMTQRVGLKPNEEEYILMGMAALGDPKRFIQDIKQDFIQNTQEPNFNLKRNVHRGIMWWRPDLTTTQDFYDLAAAMQEITEDYLIQTAKWCTRNLPSRNLVMMGGVALNCVANAKIAHLKIFRNIHIMPNPGDAGSSIGAVTAHTKQHIEFTTPYLGYNITRPFDEQGALQALTNGEVIGVATGRAEFGPRALGNRSIMADPRGQDVKDKVNNIKKRELFRPFAPVIMEEHAHEYFYMPYHKTPYMQYTAICKYPNIFPAICHFDNTSRVQTVNQHQNPTLYNLLKEFYQQTNCPMLLNTSLNIKGQPLVNTWEDALKFQSLYGIKVF